MPVWTVLEQASQWHEMCCHDLEVMSSNPGRVELGLRSTSVLSVLDPKYNMLLFKQYRHTLSPPKWLLVFSLLLPITGHKAHLLIWPHFYYKPDMCESEHVCSLLSIYLYTGYVTQPKSHHNSPLTSFYYVITITITIMNLFTVKTPRCVQLTLQLPLPTLLFYVPRPEYTLTWFF